MLIYVDLFDYITIISTNTVLPNLKPAFIRGITVAY